MPSYVCLSPTLADHCFPRSEKQLRIVAIALGRLSELAEEQKIKIIQTSLFSQLVEGCSWEQPGLIGEIYRHLQCWFLLAGHQTVAADLDDIQNFALHPLPKGCAEWEGFQDYWAAEMGKLLVKHDTCSDRGDYFIGIACELAFADLAPNTYEPNVQGRRFPLVGPNTCDCTSSHALLSDGEEFDVPGWVKDAQVSFSQAKKNITVIGASHVDDPRGGGGSHYIVNFPGKRPWPLDKNHDPVVPDYLNQLTKITGYPLLVIKYALIEGALPEKRCRLN